MKRIIFCMITALMLHTGISSAADESEFKDMGDGTVIDYRNPKILWQKDTKPDLTWNEARRYCRDLNLGGYDDWVLPTYTDMKSISYVSGDNRIYMLTSPFNHEYGNFNFYWTAKVGSLGARLITDAKLNPCHSVYDGLDNYHRVRCVRYKGNGIR